VDVGPGWYLYRDDHFTTIDLEPVGSPTGLSLYDSQTPAFAFADYDVGFHGLRLNVFSDPSRFRVTGWVFNRSEWMPYSAIGSTNYVRAKYYVFLNRGIVSSPQGGIQVGLNAIPNFRVRAANRF